MIWIILFAALGICAAIVGYLQFNSNLYSNTVIILLFVFGGLVMGMLEPISVDECIESSKTYKLANIASDYNINSKVYLYAEYDETEKDYKYQFLVESLDQKPNYGKTIVKIDENYKTPMIEIYSYRKLNSFWSFQSTDDLAHSTIYISPKDIYYKERD